MASICVVWNWGEITEQGKTKTRYKLPPKGFLWLIVLGIVALQALQDAGRAYLKVRNEPDAGTNNDHLMLHSADSLLRA